MSCDSLSACAVTIRSMRVPVVSALVVFLLAVSADAQLLHRYDFETAGSANDTVGTAHGTRYGTATISGGALNTTGDTGGLSGGVPQNCVKLPATAVAGINNAFSIEVWYLANYNGGNCTLFSFSANNANNYVLATPAFGTLPYQSRVAVKGGGGSSSEQSANQIYCDAATLRNMIVTYDGTNVTYYLDGNLSTYAGLPNSFTDVGLVLSNLTYIGIAGGAPYGDNTINGKVYDFRIYGQALTVAQVAAICGLGKDASNSAIANALAAAPPSGPPFNANLVDLPLYGDFGVHDPSKLIKQGGVYYTFITSQGIVSKSSTDLRNWNYNATVFPGNPPAWTTNAVPDFTGYFWAPDIAYFNGKYHLYYSCSSWGSIDSAIGLVTSPSLSAPTWTDQGKVVQSDAAGHTQPETDTTAYNCIDPSILVDTNGTVWMSFGSYSSGILVTQLDPTTGKRLNTNTLVATLVANNAGGGWGSTIEASYLYQRGGYYYLFVNYGGCCSDVDSTYNIRVGRSVNVTGPYYDQDGVNLVNGGGTIFSESTGRYIGPGHASILDDNGTNYFSYHYYDGNGNGYPLLGLANLYWSVDGWPVLTNDWSALYPLAADANESSGLYNGALQNGAGFTSDPDRGSVLHLDGVTKYVSLPLSVGNARSFAAWVKWNGGDDWQRIFDFGADTADYFYLSPRSGDGNMRFAIKNGGGEQQINAPFAFPTNSWHHVAVTLDGSRGVLYFDGAPVATNTSLTIRPWETLPQNNNIGKSQFSADPTFGGDISSFRIYGRALSAAEISDMFAANPTLSHRYSFSTNGPVAVWDSIGMAHGTLQGNATVTNNALRLPGSSGSYANLPGGLVSGSSAVTLEFWATFLGNNSWVRVFDAGAINGANGYNFFYFSPHSGLPGQRMEINTSSFRNLEVGGTLDNRTVHVACICDPPNNYMAIYTNGVLEASLSASMPALTGVSRDWSFIGRSLFSSDAYLNATIDELRLYDGRLTPAQIGADYLAGPDSLASPVTPEVPTGLSAVAGDAAVRLSWNTATNATGYNVRRSFTSGGSYTTIAVNVSGLNYTNTGLANGTLYYYVVSATNTFTGLESSNSVPVSARPVSFTKPNFSYTFAGNSLTATWPTSHTGWRLQVQTNGLNSNGWSTVTDSATTNFMVLPIADGTPIGVFYRLVYP